jgi:hypothetical protein
VALIAADDEILRARRIAAGRDPVPGTPSPTAAECARVAFCCATNPRSRPAMNRCCHRCTVTLLVRACLIISRVGAKPAVADKIRARHTCFCALFR